MVLCENSSSENGSSKEPDIEPLRRIVLVRVPLLRLVPFLDCIFASFSSSKTKELLEPEQNQIFSNV